MSFPLALLLFASIADAAALATGSGDWGSVARRAMSGGVSLGFLVSLTGVLEIFLRQIPPQTLARLALHAGLMHAGLIGCLVSLLMREPGPPQAAAVIVGFAGTGTLTIGAALGHSLAVRLRGPRAS